MRLVSGKILSLLMVFSMILSGTLIAAEAPEDEAIFSQPELVTAASDYPFRTIYPSLAQLDTWYNTLLSEYPGLVTKIDIGNSWEGRDLWVLKLTSSEEGVTGDKPSVLINGNIHTREWSGSQAAAYFAWLMLYNYDSNDTIHWLLNNRIVYVLPMSNPDGYNYDGNGNYALRLSWRKDRRNNGDGTYGVDLNRNWDIMWSSGNPTTSADDYRGPSPFSEYETQAIRDFITINDVDSFQDIHSYAGTLLIPPCYAAVPSAHEAWFRSAAAKMTYFTTQMGAATTYTVGRPDQTIGYSAPGGSIDWTYEAKGLQSYCFELATGGAGFYPTTANIMAINQDVDDALIYQSRVADVDLGDGTTDLFPPAPYIIFGHVLTAGAPVPGTPVELSNTVTGETLTINTDSNGYYELNLGMLTQHGYSMNDTFRISSSPESIEFAIDGLWGKKLDMADSGHVAGLTVQHYGPGNSTTTLSRYLRGIPSETRVNGLLGHSLGTGQSTTLTYYHTSVSTAINTYAGIRVWKRTPAGAETEITSGTAVATAGRTSSNQGLVSATYTPTSTSLGRGDCIVIRLYVATSTAGLTTARAEFVTEPLGPGTLSNNQWTVYYYIRRNTGTVGGLSGSFVAWGTGTYNSYISGFRFSALSMPMEHNTLNWTASAGASYYRVLRCDTQSGTYELAGIVPSGTTTFVDRWMGQADSIYWWYRVLAVNVAYSAPTPVQEPGAAGVPYSISLVSRSAGTWVFVSYPVTVSGHIEAVLNDTANGDGGTNWDVARTWDNQLKKWLTYRKGGTNNGFTSVENQKGYWLHLTSNGADQLLTVPSTGAYPGTVAITLYAGWNLVGYPSATNRLASATLPGVADMVSLWQAASPYFTDTANLGSVTMSHGNGYWVRVTATTTWTVQP